MALSLTYDGVLSRVRITGPAYLNANPFFETDASNWSAPAGGTVERSTAFATQGVASLLLTPAGTSAFAEARSESMLGIVAGATYVVRAYVRCAVARTVRTGIRWRTAADAFISTDDIGIAVPATTFTLIGHTAVAPATAARAELTIYMNATPPATDLLYIDEATLEPTPVKVERSTNQVTWTTVRGGADVAPDVLRAISLDDYEFSPDVTNYYRAAGQDGYGPALNANTSFEVDTSGWAGQSATIARSTAQFHAGVASLLITPDGVAASGGAIADRVATIPATVYRASMWAYSPGGWSDLRPAVDWWTALSGGTFISTSLGIGFSVAAGVWTYLEQIFTAPAGANAAQLRARHGGTPAAVNTWHIDEATLAPAGITPVLDGVWLKSLARPFLNRKVLVTDWSDVERQSRSGVFPIVGRSFPIAVTDLHGSRQWTLDVAANTAQEAEELDLLFSTGEVQFVHVPAAERIPGGYVALGDTTERRPQPRSIRRIFSMPLTKVAAPGPDVIPAVGTWQSVINTYASWNAVLAAHADWASVLQLVGSAQDVVVP